MRTRLLLRYPFLCLYADARVVFAGVSVSVCVCDVCASLSLRPDCTFQYMHACERSGDRFLFLFIDFFRRSITNVVQFVHRQHFHELVHRHQSHDQCIHQGNISSNLNKLSADARTNPTRHLTYCYTHISVCVTDLHAVRVCAECQCLNGLPQRVP